MLMTKQDQRTAAMATRTGQDPAFGFLLAGHVLASWRFLPGIVVAGFWPLPGEIDIRPLLLALAGRGHPVALPITPRRGRPLTFARWRPGDALVPERFGTVRPVGEPLVPDLLLVPLLAFDGQCRRLGYGGGFYDRTLAALPGRVAIGCAFAAQRVDCVVAEAHDMRLDAIATEGGLIFPEG
jgi:5-formyltetrahydrofolate cyclo-ligase